MVLRGVYHKSYLSFTDFHKDARQHWGLEKPQDGQRFLGPCITAGDSAMTSSVNLLGLKMYQPDVIIYGFVLRKWLLPEEEERLALQMLSCLPI